MLWSTSAAVIGWQSATDPLVDGGAGNRHCSAIESWAGAVNEDASKRYRALAEKLEAARKRA